MEHNIEISTPIRNRFSTVTFSSNPIELISLMKILEAARWAPSAFNNQPWRFIYALKEDTNGFNLIFDSLIEYNKQWAHSAGLLIVNTTRRTFEQSGKVSTLAQFELGMAVSNMIIQAMELGIYSHQMAGFNQELVRKNLNISNDFEILSITAFGYLGNSDTLPETFKEKEAQPRTRKSIEEIASIAGERL